MGRSRIALLLTLAALGSIACGERSAPPEPEPAPAADPPAAPAADPPPAAAAGPVVTEERFELRAAASGPYRPGALSQFSITLTPRAGWHVNMEYPTRIDVTAPAEVALPKATLERDDAAQFEEDAARFEVPFTSSAAGSHAVQAQVSFAICTESNCEPAERTLALTLPVEAQ